MLESDLRRRRAEHELDEQREELAHALRVTTLGELAASFAHELGQPLTAILSNAQAARRFREKDPSDVEIDHALTDIAQSAKRAGDIIARLRRLFRKEHAERAPVDVNDVIYEVLRLLRTDLIQKNIDVRVTAGQGLRLLHADPVQLRQVILNVLVNAEDAIDATREGPREIHVETHLSDAGRIAITVRDTGVGAEESQLEHMFEHFVSSKPRGLGMGLAISRSIVEAHGGRIWATRNEGRGLTLHIELQPAQPSA
jgi:two-component system sensor kinase FixL